VQLAQLKDFPQRTIVAESVLYVCEVKNKDVLALLSKQTLGEVRDKLKRFNGYPEDVRWRATSRNAPLMHLLEQQLAVRDFLASMVEEIVAVPRGHVFQDGRSASYPDAAFVVNEGLVRISLMTGLVSYRGGDVSAAGVAEPYDVGRGSIVGDMNAIMKKQKSSFRIVAVKDCEVFMVPRDALMQFLDDFPGVKFLFIDRVHVGYSFPAVSVERSLGIADPDLAESAAGEATAAGDAAA